MTDKKPSKASKAGKPRKNAKPATPVDDADAALADAAATAQQLDAAATTAKPPKKPAARRAPRKKAATKSDATSAAPPVEIVPVAVFGATEIDVTPATDSALETAPDAPPQPAPEIASDAIEPLPAVAPAASSTSASTRAAVETPSESYDSRPPGRAELQRLADGDHGNPHAILGAHQTRVDGQVGVAVRALVPNAVAMDCLLADGRVVEMTKIAAGIADVYECFLADASLPISYRLRSRYADGAVWERDDPYRFLPTLGDVDLHLFNEGTHRQLWKKLGAHLRTIDGVAGASFAVWAPNARRVSVVGEFCGWDGRIFPMRRIGGSGVWKLFIPEIGNGALYRFEMLTREGAIRVKTDPFAAKMAQAPGTASIVQADDLYQWGDGAWMTAREGVDWPSQPMSIYEVHLGSWARKPEEGDRHLSYREIAPRLAQHVQDLGFTHVELMPVMEHPFYGSWGYQVSGYYAPSSRYGTPDDFRFLVDTLHQRGIGVILDWVPAHFPKDDFALRRFDGTALYEHDDPRLGEHPDWGTLIFNYGRNEVRNFLIANALYWLNEFHADGLRVDAVASMLYLDYSRQAGQWIKNRLGGRENLDAIDFLKQFNEAVRLDAPGCITIAEESTAWPNVTVPVADGGLGFTFKWNMGWMHDSLAYFSLDPIHRRFHHDQITFAMLYEYSERFIMPLSHDEVVHLKGSLLTKMPGDEWQRFANLRLMLAYMFTRPGKKLVFMGTELAPWTEWNHDRSLDWHLVEDPNRAAFAQYLARLATVYRNEPAFWEADTSWEGFAWIDVADRENSVVSYLRRAGDSHAVVVLNLTPLPRERYRIGVPSDCRYERLLSSDDAQWGGSGFGEFDRLDTDQIPFHGFEQSIEVTLPPLGALVLAPARP